ncbi:MAG: hypothetical protein J6B34_05060 [Clostridia bacterium]|nr:hypothetical protein [Clostridia bacterium]
MKKKLLLVFAMVAMLACLFALAVNAAEPSYKDGEWIYAADGTTKLAIRDTDGNPLIWYMNGDQLKWVRADQTDSTQAVYVKYSIGSGGSGFDSTHTPEKCLKDIDIFDNGTQIECATINSQLVLFNMERLDVDALNGWLFGNKNGCCTILRGIVFPSTLKYMGQEGFTNHKVVQMWNLENTQFEWHSPYNTSPFSSRTLTQEATNYTIKFPATVTTMPSVQYSYVKTVIYSPNVVVGNANQTLRECYSLEKVYLGNGFFETGFNGECFRGTNGLVMFFTGTEEQAQALKDNSANDWGHNNHFKDDRTQIISYETYLQDPAKYDSATNNIYIVYGYNYCDAFHDSVHEEDNNPCIVNCTRCGVSGVAEENPVHSTTVVMEYTNLFATGLKTVACTNDGCQLCDETELNPIFHWVGYSAKTFGDEKAFGQQYVINQAELGAYKAYVESQGDIFSYGVVAAGASSAGQPLSVAGNEVVNKEGAQSICFDQLTYDAFFMNISGIDAGSLDVALMCCAYVRVGNEIVYLDNNQTVDTVELTSFAKIDAIVNPKEDIA